MIIDNITRTIRRILVGRQQKFIFSRRENISIPPLSSIGMYIHIPFCKSMCPYCPYNRIPYQEDMVQPYIEALLSEIEQYSSRLGKIEISSIYIGGGTPTTLAHELGTVIQNIRDKFEVRGEICIETNPGDLDGNILRILKENGVTLISIGVQSFNQNCLKALGRNYSSNQAVSAVKLALSANFKSVNIDLMFALPGQDTDDILHDLEEAVNLGATQITNYPLFTFPYSAVGRYLKIRRVKMPDFTRRRRMFKQIYNYLTRSGYHRISVWGFEKGNMPRYSSVTRDNYIGIGAGACSNLPQVFYLNTFSVKEYIQTASEGKLPVAAAMDITPGLRKYYWLYWRFYDTRIDKQQFTAVFGKSRLWQTIFGVMKGLHLSTENQGQIQLGERGAFYIHLLQNYFVLNYINKVWTAALAEAWPQKIEI
jgi:oxygen-independent coproporphyrinogen-3 oxidase